jgi:UDP-N-acetylmuramoyl-L-alanyl-D-glutamate--2,6-diaminopimelate ligase
MKTLSQLFVDFPLPPPVEVPAVSIGGISIDSRLVQPGDLFVALHGESVDGHRFIPQAVERGAACVLGEKELPGIPVPYVRLENTRQALTWLAASFHDWPGRHLSVVGITGTDGKTTTSNLLYQILSAAGIRAGMISTVNAVIGDDVLDTGFHVTTPDAHDVQRYLRQMVDAGLTHAVLETTSHGWAQHRVDACEFDVGVVTNITHEHLDEHGSYENYRAAKARLISSLEWTLPKPQGNPRLAVLNHDDQSFPFLEQFTQVSRKSYGIGGSGDVQAEEIHYAASETRFVARSTDFRITIKSPLVGAFNISNCLAAITAAVCGLNISPDFAAQGIASFQGVPGRMERIDMGQDFTAIVDFAHTPNALKVALETAREMLPQTASGAPHRPRVIAVFGSAGLRDRAKRRMMAETSARLADLTVLTAEDPRTESLDAILDEMSQGARYQGAVDGQSLWRVPDRGEAIKFAVSLARPGDIVMACGKGHEQSMCFGATEYAWDDRIAMRAALAQTLGTPGPQMPYLPSSDRPEAEWLE